MTLSDIDITVYKNKIREISGKEVSFDDAKIQSEKMFNFYNAMYSKNVLMLGKSKIDKEQKNMQIYDKDLAVVLYSLNQKIINIKFSKLLNCYEFIFELNEEIPVMINQYNNGKIYLEFFSLKKSEQEINKIIKQIEETPIIKI